MSWTSISSRAAADFLDAAYYGPEINVSFPVSFSNLGPHTITFLTGRWTTLPSAPGSCLVVTVEDMVEPLVELGFGVISHASPKFAFCKIVQNLMSKPREKTVHPTAIIGPEVELGEQVQIGAFSILEGKVCIGDRVVIESHVRLENSVTVGMSSHIHGGVQVGYDPFSFGASDSGEAHLFPATGGVSIGQHVHVFPNSSIARGTAGDTVLADWVRVGNHVYIGNMVSIGEGTTICSAADISARVRIGERCWIAPRAAIRQGLSVGSDATVGTGAVVVSDVAADTIVVGVPARTLLTED